MGGMRLWIAVSTADAALRLGLQMLTTIVAARMLSPEDFGVGGMILTVVAVFSTLIGFSMEEAMAQRSRLLLGHVQTALFVALSLTAAVLVLAPGMGFLLARATGVGEIALWLPLAALFLVGEGPGGIVRAVARRRRRFVLLGLCQSGSVLIASAAAIAAALLGQSVLVLVLQRMLPVLVFPILALAATAGQGSRRRVLVRPVWHPERFRELQRFSWLHLGDVGVGAITPAAIAYSVNAAFGTLVLGQLNMALRLVDPLRALIGGIGHNLVFSLLYRMQEAPRRLLVAAAEVVGTVGTLAVPAFLGLAVCAPLLLPALVGPGWELAAQQSRVLCLAAAIYVPIGFLYTGFSAMGRPEWGLWASLLHLATTLSGVWLIHAVGLGSGVGTALLVGDVAMSAFAMALLAGAAGREAGPPLVRVARIWGAAALMALVLDLARLRFESMISPVALLAALVFAGMLLYPPLLLAACRPCFENLRDFVARRGVR